MFVFVCVDVWYGCIFVCVSRCVMVCVGVCVSWCECVLV